MRILLFVLLLVAIGLGCSESASIDAEEDPVEKAMVDTTDQNIMEGYEPSQPIAFSHSIHAGENGIDCKYCHNAATESNTAGIPSVNVCMNCHKTISRNNPTQEIQKLYDAAGYDPQTNNFDKIQKPLVWKKNIHSDIDNFPHHAHVKANISCNSCHKVNNSTDLQDDWVCSRCHN